MAIRYRDGMTEDELQKFLLSVEELDAAYARAEEEISVLDEEDESAEEAQFYEELNREYSKNR
jgi:hypothetical protein